ncbi:MAG: glycosyltransferase family 39 protein [Anaerolineae bacterium]|nr:glycosyltransferase family 39 protein [Anaerolineae bacterium]
MKSAATTPKQLFITTAVLLAAAFAIISHLGDLSMRDDEVMSILHSSRDIEFLVRDRDITWPPGYYLMLNTWMNIVGYNDVAIRMLNALGGMLAAASVYRVAAKLSSRLGGWAAALAFGTSGYTIYFLSEVRGYAFCISFGALLALLQLRWVVKPTWRRTIPYVLVQIALVYMHFTGWFGVILAGIHTLLNAPRHLVRWMGVFLIVALAFAPIAPQFLQGIGERAGAAEVTQAYSHTLLNLYQAYSVHRDLLFAAIVALAVAGWGWFVYRKRRTGALLWLLAWGVGIPFGAYVTNPILDMFKTRYLAIAMTGVFLLIGIGIAHLPRAAARALGAGLVILLALMPWQPQDHRDPVHYDPPYKAFVQEMAARFRPGDALVIDPGCGNCAFERLWWYYETIYFPGGRIPRAADGDAAPGSVWYITEAGRENPEAKASAAAGRIETAYWGPWYFHATYYEKPPLAPGYRVGDTGLQFLGARIFPDKDFYLPGDRIEVQSWWSTGAPLPEDYTIGLYLIRLNNGRLVAQTDAGPAGVFTLPQTSHWQPGALYRDDRTLRIPWELEGACELRLAVYRWQTGDRLPPAPGAPQIDGAIQLKSFNVTSWGDYPQD